MSSQKEVELTFVCRLDDVSQLLSAVSCEEQEQYIICTQATEDDPIKREFRIRKSRTKGETTYTATAKMRPRDGAVVEQEAPTTEECFNALKLVASDGMFKYRYRFPYPEPIGGQSIFWEVDVYVNEATGGVHPWCRVELEMPTTESGEVLMPNTIERLPIKFAEVLSQADPDPKVQEQIRALYGQYFVSRQKR